MISILTQRVNRRDVGMFELPGDLGLADESILAAFIVGEILLDSFQGDFAVEMTIVGDEYLPEASRGMRPDDLKSPRPVSLRLFWEHNVDDVVFARPFKIL